MPMTSVGTRNIYHPTPYTPHPTTNTSSISRPPWEKMKKLLCLIWEETTIHYPRLLLEAVDETKSASSIFYSVDETSVDIVI